MIVVSDTSPLNYLILIGAIDLLPRLFSEVFLPTEVMEELKSSLAPETVKTWVQSPPQWVRVATPSLTITTSIRLDAGELQAIALAKEIHADALLIDERKGWRVASEHGLNVVGTLNVLWQCVYFRPFATTSFESGQDRSRWVPARTCG